MWVIKVTDGPDTDLVGPFPTGVAASVEADTLESSFPALRGMLGVERVWTPAAYLVWRYGWDGVRGPAD